MFLFKLPGGKCILHTGDFRASHYMEEEPAFWNNDIDTIYLDTTYLSSKFDFGTQSECVDNILEMAKTFIEHCTATTAKPLIICGTYKVGKEVVWIRLAQQLGFKVWMDDERRRVLNCIQNADIGDLVTRCATDANIHLLPLINVSYPVNASSSFQMIFFFSYDILHYSYHLIALRTIFNIFFIIHLSITSISNPCSSSSNM